MTFLIGPEFSGLTFTATALFFAGDTAYLGDGWLTAEVTASELTLNVGLPPITDAIQVGDTTWLYLYMLALHQDSNGDGFHSGVEEVDGVSLVWLAYLEGPPVPDLPPGFQEGWNAFDLSTESTIGLDAIPVPANLLPTEEIEISGTYPHDPDGMGLLLYPQVDSFPSSLLYDEPVSSPWSISVSGQPPFDHMIDLGGGIWGALEYPLFYQDLDHSVGISEGDAATEVACNRDGNAVLLYYIEPFSDIMNGFNYAVQGLRPGWLGLISLPDGSAELADPQDLINLDACAAEF
jgi:hypothetical protein